jgi:hypothetical protein
VRLRGHPTLGVFALSRDVLSGIANYYLETGQGIEYVADHLGHRNIQNTRIHAQITTSLRQKVFAKLEHHPKIVRILEDISPGTGQAFPLPPTSLPAAGLYVSRGTTDCEAQGRWV